MQPSSPPADRRQRVAWFFGGVVAALAGLALLGPALAAPMAQQQESGPRPIPMGASGMSADSNNRMIAVTGVDITGQSVLYLVDTENYQLAVYQASGGAGATQNIKLVGARRIDLDMQLDGFNDKTELDGQPLTYKDLARRFDQEVGKSR
ncbi:MAG: hypothetical protein AAGA20_15295 [Planctomycetota bacterium]